MKRIFAMIMIIGLAASTSACGSNPLPSDSTPSYWQTATPLAIAATPILASKAAIQPSPSPTPEATMGTENGDDDQYGDGESPLQNDIPDLANVGLTDDQYSQIDTLLACALELPFFDKASQLKRVDLLNFAVHALECDVLGDDQGGKDEFSKEDIEKIIQSAFALAYHPREGDAFEDYITFKDGEFTIFDGDFESGMVARPYSISRLSPDKLLLKFNIVGVSDVGDCYGGKGQAVIEEDTNSLFGYHLISLTMGKETIRKFDAVTVSSSLPAHGGKSFGAGNAIDGKDKTAWVTSDGTGEWILLNFDTPHDITGLDFSFGDWTNEDAFEQCRQPVDIKLKFSDGTTITTGGYFADAIGEDYCITFGRKLKTTFVKMTIESVTNPDNSSQNVYVTDISPF